MAGTAKAFTLSPDYVLYEMSYANVLLYGASLPQYIPKKDRRNVGDEKYNGTAYGAEVIKADDPRNADKMKQFFATLRD